MVERKKVNLKQIVTKNEHICLLGQTGCGKTYGMLDLIDTAKNISLFIFDVKQEDFNKLKGFKIVKNFIDFKKEILNKDKKIKKIIVQDSNLLDNFEQYLTFLWNIGKNYRILIDEITRFVTKAKIPSIMERFYVEGRSKGRIIWSAGQRFQLIHNTILSQSNFFWVFWLGIKSDREQAADWLDLAENNTKFQDLTEFESFFKHNKAREKVYITKF